MGVCGNVCCVAAVVKDSSRGRVATRQAWSAHGEGSTLTVGNFLSLENLNVIIRAIN